MLNDSSIRVLLVEDHPLYRIGLRMALSYSGSNCTILNEAENVKNAKEFIEKHSGEIDVVLLDYYLPDGNGLEVVNAIKTHCPDTKILLISAETNPPEIKSLMKAGINGFISKNVTSQELSLIIDSIFHGHDCFDKSLSVLDENKPHEDEKEEKLSQREVDVMRLCAKGLTAKQIAEELHISPRTVEKHKDRLFNKLCLNSTVELVNYAIRKGLV